MKPHQIILFAFVIILSSCSEDIDYTGHYQGDIVHYYFNRPNDQRYYSDFSLEVYKSLSGYTFYDDSLQTRLFFAQDVLPWPNRNVPVVAWDSIYDNSSDESYHSEKLSVLIDGDILIYERTSQFGQWPFPEIKIIRSGELTKQ